MAQEVVDKAFDPFFTTKAAGAGTGLGLSQVYGFIRQSGGHVRIYSEPGEGTIVKLYLPRSLARETRPASGETAGECLPGNHETVLVVEDDPDVRAYVIETLAGLDYEVRSAAHAAEALEILNNPGAVDLLLTDVVMPGMNGRDLADAARLCRPGLKVLYMTGYSRNAIVHQGRLDAGVALMQKPFSQNVLAARVRTILEEA
jgi:CheY-like chemotaxis protein